MATAFQREYIWEFHQEVHLAGIKNFLEMWSQWCRVFGPLREEDPVVLLGVLQLIIEADGATQRTIETALRLKQSRVSKLIKKLEADDWVKAHKSATDKRVVLVTATVRTKNALRQFDNAIRGDPAAREKSVSRRQPSRVPEGQLDLLTALAAKQRAEE